MVAGSVASSLHGEPRATNDVDIVIAPSREQLGAFITSLGEGFYTSAGAAEKALGLRGMFNVIDSLGGWKADLIVRKDRPYSLAEFGRRVSAEVMGIKVSLVSPEDAILSKLEWAKKGASERQFRDAFGVAAAQRESLDRAYLRKWAPELDVEALLRRLLDELDHTG
jgi:hypothetical protein